MARLAELITDRPINLKTEWTLIILFSISVLLLFFCSLELTLGWRSADYWLFQTLPIACLVVWQCWRLRHLNRPSMNAANFADLGWGNRLTLLRGLFIAMTGGFFALQLPTGFIAWLPGVLYCLAALLDRIDGFVARRSRRTTLLGEKLDTLFDALGLVIAPLVAVDQGKLHWSFLLVSAAYYLFQAGLYWRRKQEKPIFPMMPSQLRRTFAGFQMGFVGVVLLPLLHSPITILLGVVFMLPLLLGFIVDWLVVTGKIDGNAEKTQQFLQRLRDQSATLLQPALRIFLCLLILIFLSEASSLTVTNISLTIAFGLLLLGMAGRIGALLFLLVVTSQPTHEYIDAITCAAVFAAVAILLLGAGRFSIWQADDIWVNRQDGV